MENARIVGSFCGRMDGSSVWETTSVGRRKVYLPIGIKMEKKIQKSGMSMVKGRVYLLTGGRMVQNIPRESMSVEEERENGPIGTRVEKLSNTNGPVRSLQCSTFR